MGLLDYLLPWKAVPNMVNDVKKASSTSGKGKYDSVFGAIGKYADPFGALLGSDVQNFMHGTIPREVNRAVQPWNELHMKYLDPLTMSGAVGKGPMDAARYKGGDLTAGALGATAAGMMTGGFGLGGAGGSGGSGAPMMPMMPMGGGQQQPQQQMRQTVVQNNSAVNPSLSLLLDQNWARQMRLRRGLLG